VSETLVTSVHLNIPHTSGYNTLQQLMYFAVMFILVLYNSGRTSVHRFPVAVVKKPYDHPCMVIRFSHWACELAAERSSVINKCVSHSL
jgi:hypothetical protein